MLFVINPMQIATQLITNQEQQFLKNHFVCEEHLHAQHTGSEACDGKYYISNDGDDDEQ